MTDPENPILSSLGSDPEDIARGLREFSKSAEMLSNDRPSLINEHPLQWVGVYRGKVSARADDLPSLMEELERRGIPLGDTIVRFIEEEPAHADPLACCGEDSATPPVGLTWRDMFCSPGWDGAATSRSFSTPERTRPC